MAAPKLVKFNTIPATDVKVAPRGRKVQTDPSLVAAFANLPDDQALDLSPLFQTVAPKDRPSVGQTIRKNWKAARPTDPRPCRIDFGTEGVPMVRVNTKKVVAEATADA